MRFAVFLALLVVTFVATCSSFASAENTALANDSNRRLRASEAIEEERAMTKLEASNKFVTKLKEKAIIAKAQRMMAGAADAAKLSDDQMAKLAKMVADNAKKDKSSWPRLKKALKITLGVGVTSVILYAAYKMLFGNKATQVPSTTTTGSA